MKLTVKQIADGIHNGMFAERDTIKEAYEYALDCFKTGSEAHCLTGLQVVLNTISNKLTEAQED